MTASSTVGGFLRAPARVTLFALEGLNGLWSGIRPCCVWAFCAAGWRGECAGEVFRRKHPGEWASGDGSGWAPGSFREYVPCDACVRAGHKGRVNSLPVLPTHWPWGMV